MMLALSAAASAAGTAEPPSPAPARVVVGELTRVDIGRRAVSVKPEAREAARADGGDAREVDAAVGPETRVVSRGRTLRLEDLRPGDRVVLVVGEEGGRRLARVVRVAPRVIRIESATR
jgi:hypothetical protein